MTRAGLAVTISRARETGTFLLTFVFESAIRKLLNISFKGVILRSTLLKIVQVIPIHRRLSPSPDVQGKSTVEPDQRRRGRVAASEDLGKRVLASSE
jgi:hypothetical protein